MELITNFSDAGDLLMARASRATGLDDFGDDFSQGYTRFLEAVEHEAQLSEAGRHATAGFAEGLLAARLMCEQAWKDHPDCLAHGIRRPLIITGIVRSGTTALHRLLSIDPQFQGLEHWLTRTPMPRPPHDDWAGLPQYREAQAIVAAMVARTPEFFEDHMMSVDGVEESLNVLAHSFVTNMIASQWHIPSYDKWYRQQNDTPSYARFAKVLKLIGAHSPARTWLLKNPTDTHAMDAVLNVFPDAMIVQTHRDPMQAVPSVVNLIHAGQKTFAGSAASANLVMRREAEMWAEALERCDTARAQASKQFVDVEFGDFIADPMASVRAIYGNFGLTLDADVEVAMRLWLSSNPRRSTKLQRFTPESYGMRGEDLAVTYKTYRARRGYA